MGRPKLSDLSCTICNIKFKRKSLLDDHMDKHLSSSNQNRQPRKQLKAYCGVCKKSFEPEKYKIHIQIEHEFDMPMNKNGVENDLFSYENGFVLLSKRKIKKDIRSKKKKSAVEKNKSLDVSFSDIKIEPIDKISEDIGQAEHQKTENKKSVQKKVGIIKCSICGIRCKGKKGLKIHMCAHKRSRGNSDNDTPQCENKINKKSKLSHSSIANNVSSSFNNNTNAPLLISNNGDASFTQNAQPNYVLNASHFQNQSNNLSSVINNPNNVLNFGNQVGLLNSAIQPHAQLQSVPSQHIDSSANIPKFDCDSEKYMKWLKQFVKKCTGHKYPLNPELCKKISFVTEEITHALGNPKSSLKHKSNHFYLMNMYNTLTEIMLSHLQSTLCGVNK